MGIEIEGRIDKMKRKSPRLEERDKVTVTVLSAPDAPMIEHKKFHCWTYDLSEGGLKFKVHSNVPIGVIVGVEVLFLSDGGVFEHIGKVGWEREFDEDGLTARELGIKFTETVGGESKAAEWKAAINSRL
jgi:hypothetical protein